MALQWKSPGMAAWLDTIHPQLRRLLIAFDVWSVSQGLPQPVITDLVRDMDGQVRIYLGHYQRLRAALVPGPHQLQIDPEEDGKWRRLSLQEEQEAKEIRALTPEQLEERARSRFTWHWVRCAADIRTWHYTPSQLHTVALWFRERTATEEWEFKIHDVHGPHIHVGRRDKAWREQLDPRKGSA